jgi:hypothetical protein
LNRNNEYEKTYKINNESSDLALELKRREENYYEETKEEEKSKVVSEKGEKSVYRKPWLYEIG